MAIKHLKEEREKKKEKLKANKESRLEEVLKLKEMWKRREDSEVTEEDEDKENEEEREDDVEGEGAGEDGEQGRQNSTMVGDNAHMAQASDNPWLKWKIPASNNLTKSPKGGKLVRGPKHEIVGGSNPPALRNGQAKEGDQPSDPPSPDPFEEEIEEELLRELPQDQAGDGALEEGDEEHPQVGDIDYIGAHKMCLECAYAPCICTILKNELKIKALKVKVLDNTENKIERKRKRSEEECEETTAEGMAGHKEDVESTHSLCPDNNKQECGRSETPQKSVVGSSLCPTKGPKEIEKTTPEGVAGQKENVWSTQSLCPDNNERECGHSACRQQSVGGHTLCPTTGPKDPGDRENKEEELTTTNKDNTTPYKDNKTPQAVAVVNKTTPETTRKIPTKNISKLLKTTLSMFENNIQNKKQTLEQQTTKKFKLQQPKLKLMPQGTNNTTKQVEEEKEKQQTEQQEKEPKQQENETSNKQPTNKNTTNNRNKRDEQTTSTKSTRNNKREETTSTQEETQKLSITLQQPKLKLQQATTSGTTTPKTTNETKKPTTKRKKKPEPGTTTPKTTKETKNSTTKKKTQEYQPKTTRKQPSITGYITTNKHKQEERSTTNTNTTNNKPEVTTNNEENKTTATKGIKTTTTDTKTTTNGDKTTNSSNNSTTTTTNDNKQQPKIRHKPPNIDQLTPVKLAVKVRGTKVTDLKEFLARKKSERDSAQAKRLRAPESSGENNSTLTKPNTGTGRTRQEVGK